MDQTDRNTSALTVQDEDENSSDQDTQLAPGSNLNVVDNKGPVQIGTGSTVNSPVYNNCNFHFHYHPSHPAPHNDYPRWVEQTAAALGSGPSHPGLPPCSVPERPSGDHLQDQSLRNEHTTDRKTFHHHHGDSSSSFHVPCHCWDCLHYHRNDHPPLAENTRPQQPRHSQLPHHAVPQLLPSPQQTELTERKETSPSGRDQQCTLQETSPVPSVVTSDVRHHVTTGQQEAKDESNEKQTRPKQATEGQRSSQSQRSPAGDVTHNVTRAEPGERNETVTAKTADRENVKSKNTSTVSESAETSQVCWDVIQDTVCIMDSEGQALEPGDAVKIGSGFSAKAAIYVGNQQVVGCLKGGLMVVKQKLEMTAPFRKCTVYSQGECQVFPPRERVDRATAKIGRKFEEGDVWWYGSDFPTWVFTGLGWFEVGDQTAGTDNSHLNVYLYYTHTSTFYTPITYLISLSTVLMFIRKC